MPRTTGIERALGVTRVARVTGLDRAGRTSAIEVACAVRPGGHVLQVTNGKGRTWERARASAVAEAAELWASERVAPAQLVWGTVREVEHAVVPGPVIAARLRGARIAWRNGIDLLRDEAVMVPAQAVHCPPFGAPGLGPAFLRWTSNGLGAHASAREALLHALHEAVERDQLARALPHGWTPAAIRARKVAPPRALQPLVDGLRAARFEPHLFDLRADLDVPVAGAILVDRDEGPVPVTAGYACAASGDEALESALLEAAQSRLTDVHGAREDVQGADREAAAALAAACAGAPAQRPALPRHADVLGALRRGRERVVAVELARAPLHVVKVVSPSLLLSELL